MRPSDAQIAFARKIIDGKRYTNEQIKEKMQKLVKIGKGPGSTMWESFNIILEERT